MNFYLFILFIGWFAISAPCAFGQNQKTQSTKTKRLVNRTKSTRKPKSTDRHLYAGALFSTAKQIKYTGQAGNAPFTASETTSMAPGLAAGYIRRQPDGFGFNGGFIYEIPRTLGPMVGTV